MTFGLNVLPSTGWTLTNAAIVDSVLQISAGGSAEITLTEMEGTNLLPDNLLLKLVSDVYTDAYAPTSFVKLTIEYIDGNKVSSYSPIVNVNGAGFAAILFPTVDDFEGIAVSAYNSITIKFSSTVAMNLSTWSLSLEQSAGTAVELDTLYYGIKISTTNGYEAIRSDNMARAVFNADTFAMQVGDGTGTNWENKIYFDPALGKYVFDGELSATMITALQTLITPNLYADKANIAELTVDRLETHDKIAKYIGSDTSDIYFIRIQDQYIKFIQGVYDSGTEYVYNRSLEQLYWTDEQYNKATTDVTDYPITVYTYNELLKLQFSFESDGTDMVPQIILGAGDGEEGSRHGRGFIYKSDGGLYIEYVTYDGTSRIIKLTESGIDLSDFEAITYSPVVQITGIVQVWVQDDTPTGAKVKDVWIDTNDFSRYDILALTTGYTLLESDAEVITTNGTFTVTLHAATNKGIIKRISNIGTGIVTIAGTINGSVNMYLYPKECIELITDGTGWRA